MDKHADRKWLNGIQNDINTWLALDCINESTSQVSGGGAVREAEKIFSELHLNRPSLMVPSATCGMLIALKALGIKPDSEVIVPAYDWGATLSVVQTLGARPVVAPVDRNNNLDPNALSMCVTEKTKVVIVCHLNGIVDTAAVREVLDERVFVVEDCARSFGRKYKGRPVGTHGDVAVFSFGPGKTIDIGEGGMILAKNREVWECLIAKGTHPLRQMTAGINAEYPNALSLRPHPLAAILLVVALRRFATEAYREKALVSVEEKSGLKANNDYDIAALLKGGETDAEYIETLR